MGLESAHITIEHQQRAVLDRDGIVFISMDLGSTECLESVGSISPVSNSRIFICQLLQSSDQQSHFYLKALNTSCMHDTAGEVRRKFNIHTASTTTIIYTLYAKNSRTSLDGHRVRVESRDAGSTRYRRITGE
ncbi:hypothetical protein RRG08_045007 [Elysia crispata]|uniref:Uncharacterized protein n=1 Tax=Elysia crispata TaxID=231223 RepID=A0AAE1CS74_9GAST|nr:hypothetical protein RRG08_045007 [Elysia crispata]